MASVCYIDCSGFLDDVHKKLKTTGDLVMLYHDLPPAKDAVFSAVTQ